MNCTNCGFDNPEDVRFCVACGVPLPRRCRVCGEVVPARFKFCGSCGSPLSNGAPVERRSAGRRATDRRAASRPESEPGSGADPERRHLTVLFCDLVGSTGLSIRLDPEELRDVVRSYQSACAAVIERYGGYIAQYLGDGLLVYFGYPHALEDEADRAASAALGILEAIGQLNKRLTTTHGIELAVRLGLHTGVVVVGEVGVGARREQLALGDTPNIAARLQGMAAPNTIVVSPETYRLVARSFECEELGARSFKGVTMAEPVYRLLRERPAAAVRATADVRNASMLGREHELALILDRWEQAKNGQGRVVCISGDPGIGKSHLVNEFARRVEPGSGAMLHARCLPYYRNTAFHPFIDLLQRESDADPDSHPEARLESLGRMLETAGIAMENAVQLFASLLSVPTEGEPPDPPPLQKEKTRTALVQLLLHGASTQPLVLTLDDLQWADPSTLEMLDQLLPQVMESRILVLFTFRPEFGVRWASHPHVTHVYLARLHRRQAEALVTEVAGGRKLPLEVISQIVERTDGVPLFIEEITKTIVADLVEEKDGWFMLRGTLKQVAIPTTLRDSLEARLDRLPHVKEVAQIGAIIGREFSYALIREIAGDEAALDGALAELVDAGLLYARGTPPHATYVFKQALIQEAAYQSVLRSTRQRHHQRIAEVLEEKFPEVAASRPELLAFHYTAAGSTVQATEAWRRAGLRALERSANAEAVAHLTQGLELLHTMAASPERDAKELELLCTQAPALAATHGYTAPEVHNVYLRARELCTTSETRRLVQVLVGLFAYHFVRAELRDAFVLAQRLMELAQRDGVEDNSALAAHTALGISGLVTGRLTLAHEHLEAVHRTYDPARHAELAVTFGQDFGVVGHAYSALLLWLTGCADQARSRAGEALALAEQLRHPHSTALALSVSGLLYHLTGDWQAMKSAASRLHDLATRQRFGHWNAESRLMLSRAVAEEGRSEEALEVIETVIAALREADSLMPYLYHCGAAAELHARLGRPGHALAQLDEIESIIANAAEAWWWEPEVYRVRGDVLAMSGDDERAEDEYRRALDAAQSRHAHALELRAALGLARLWQRRGQLVEAHALLADCYESFTEGFDTADLRETSALLKQIGAAVSA